MTKKVPIVVDEPLLQGFSLAGDGGVDVHHRGVACANNSVNPRDHTNRSETVVCQGMGKRAHSSLQRAGVQILITSAATVRDIISQAGEGGLDDILARALSSQLGLAQPVSTLPEVTLQLFSSDAKRKRE